MPHYTFSFRFSQKGNATLGLSLHVKGIVVEKHCCEFVLEESRGLERQRLGLMAVGVVMFHWWTLLNSEEAELTWLFPREVLYSGAMRNKSLNIRMRNFGLTTLSGKNWEKIHLSLCLSHTQQLRDLNLFYGCDS